jgi:uncharacterized SAM-binding protein YcdF (DUF218 family)
MLKLLKRILTDVLIIAILLACVWLFRVPILQSVGKYLILNEHPKHSDVIVTLSGTDQAERIRHAAKLYKEGYAPKVLLSGQMVLHAETGIDLMEKYATQVGIKTEDQIREPNSKTTAENAEFSARLLAKEKVSSILLVTSPLHTRRAQMAFKSVLPKSIRVTTTCNLTDFPKSNWWAQSDILRDVMYEFLNILWFWTKS